MSSSIAIEIMCDDPFGKDGSRLIAEAGAELDRRYHELLSKPFDSSTLVGPRAAFVVARLGDTAVGCGGLRPLYYDVCELKRMFVAPEARRRGVSRRILVELEAAAVSLGYKTIFLETGVRQPEAIALYSNAGYVPMVGYGDYTEGYSVCMQKNLKGEQEMGVIVIVGYRPFEGKEEQLLDELRHHLPILRAEGLATGRKPYLMKSKDGSFVEVFEWESQEAIAKAHENEQVAAMWARFAECCEYIPLANLSEVDDLFAGFEPVALDDREH